MNQKNRLLLIVAICSLLGVLLGGAASYSETIQCLNAQAPTSNCLAQDPYFKTLQGMSSGLIAGVAAALGATWHLWGRK
ncbi:MAG: hypothetical protein JOZ78_15460 [Chroococcidiopsidaceae cyanobacterium CP_BM_ER_R8_30]|nr:hypothetical protein [Chroococcidiopsidaceae cyanobacterium CP_BM_ER_R8_30]